MMSKLIRLAKNAFYIHTDVPRHVDIEVSTLCNLKCKMCRRRNTDFGDMLMPFGSFKKIIDSLPKGVEIVTLGGYGEMLMHPEFFDMAKYAKDKGYFTLLTTNGTLLNTAESILKLFESRLDSVHVSLEHLVTPKEGEYIGHAFPEQVLRNLKQMAELRRERKSPIKIGINTVVYKGNTDKVINIIRYAESIGLDSVELIRLDTCSNEAEKTTLFEKEKKLYEKIERMKKKIKVITPINRFPKWRRLFYLGQEFCHFRCQTAHIRVNGEVTPCPYGFANQDRFGNIYERGLKEIWNSHDFRKARRTDRNPECKKCEIFKWKK